MFLPNKYERYCAAMRNYLQNAILKYGVTEKKKENLKKIIIFERVNFENELSPCDIKLLSSKLFILIYTKTIDKKQPFDFSVKIKENYFIDPYLFSIVLIKIALNSKKIIIDEILGNIVIKSNANLKIHQKLLKKLNAICFFEIKKGNLILVINAEKTSKSSVDMKKEWDISNPFSIFNIFLN